MIEIVTITCENDFDLCLYQLKSMEKFLEPCTINVVINEEDIEPYKTKIPYSKIHTIRVWSQFDILQRKAPHFNGWVNQQILKLIIPLDCDYVVLDCKDIFIKTTKLEDLKRRHRQKHPNPLKTKPWTKWFPPTIDILYKHYKTRINVKEINSIQTPRYIRKTVVSEIPKIWGDRSKFIKWFGKFGMPSEFILYDCLEQFTHSERNKKYLPREIVAFWYPEQLDFTKINDNTRIVKIHRRIYNDIDLQDKIKKWLNEVLQ